MLLIVIFIVQLRARANVPAGIYEWLVSPSGPWWFHKIIPYKLVKTCHCFPPLHESLSVPFIAMEDRKKVSCLVRPPFFAKSLFVNNEDSGKL